jgi:uncharacterized protein (DUF2235 family)
LFNALSSVSDQVTLYDDGVGPNGLPTEQLTGDEVGRQLFSKFKDGYTRIAQVYQSGDQLFLFGFSRGVYAAQRY